MSTVPEIEAALEKLSSTQQREIARWLEERLLEEESPEMLAALDEGIRSLEENGAREYTRAELEPRRRRRGPPARACRSAAMTHRFAATRTTGSSVRA